MNDIILVAYASTHGAMQEVAEQIAETLREQGLATDLQPAKDVKSLDGYGAVVLGGPLYMFRWHGDTIRFLKRHQKAIAAGIPVAVFAGGPWEDKPEQWVDVRKNVDTILAKFPWLKPVSVEIVGGKFDPAHLRFPYSLIPAMKQMPASDARDWDKIRAWAAGLAQTFQKEGA